MTNPTESHLSLAELYAQHIVDNMDTDDLMAFVAEVLEKEFVTNYTEQQLLAEIEDLSPEILED